MDGCSILAAGDLCIFATSKPHHDHTANPLPNEGLTSSSILQDHSDGYPSASKKGKGQRQRQILDAARAPLFRNGLNTASVKRRARGQACRGQDLNLFWQPRKIFRRCRRAKGWPRG
jgi:hypothetical protein